jgi:hypothetical protein
MFGQHENIQMNVETHALCIGITPRRTFPDPSSSTQQFTIYGPAPMSPEGPWWLLSGAYCLGPALRRLGIQTWRGLPSHPSGPACQRRLLLCFVLQLQLSLQFP